MKIQPVIEREIKLNGRKIMALVPNENYPKEKAIKEFERLARKLTK